MRITFVTKPLSPPWDDSGKVFPRDLADALAGMGLEIDLTGDPGRRWPHGVSARPGRGEGYAMTRAGKISLFSSLLLGRRGEIDHFIFSPTRMTARAARLLRAVRRRPIVQTILSRPARPRGVFFGDAIIVLSEETKRLVEKAGGRNVRVIPPGIRIDDRTLENGRPRDGREVLFAGDLEGGNAEALIELISIISARRPGTGFIIATRPKTGETALLEERLRSGIEAVGASSMTDFVGRVDDMKRIFDRSAVQVFPVAAVGAKTDIPLVLLEGMAAGIPSVVLKGSPAADALSGRGVMAAGDMEEMAALALEVIEGGGEEMRRIGMETVRRDYSIERIAEAYIEVYERLIGKNG